VIAMLVSAATIAGRDGLHRDGNAQRMTTLKRVSLRLRLFAGFDGVVHI